MNISFICDKKEYNFDLPLETTLNYVKKLTSKMFKCDSLDIYYKGNKIAFKDKEKNTLLKDIVTEVDSTIKLKIILNPTLNSTKNQTPSNLNSQAAIVKNLDLGVNNVNENSNKVILIKKDSLRNKLFEALYPQKTKKLNSALKEFNLKILEINNFLFKQKGGIRNDNLTTFEKRIYEFIDNLIIYIRKLISILEMNNYVTYNEMIQNLNLLYPELYTFTKNTIVMEDDINLRTLREAERNEKSNKFRSPINKFPMNLKKSDKNYTLNSDRYNYFNKSTKRPSLKKILLLDNNINNHTLDLRSLNLKGIKKINDNKSDKKKKKENDKSIKITNDDNDNSSHGEEDKNKENKIDDIFDFSSEANKEKNKDNNPNDNDEFNDIFKKTINNISRITSKTGKSNESNKNILNEEEIKNLNINITPLSSNKSNNVKININKDKNESKSKESEMEKNINDNKKNESISSNNNNNNNSNSNKNNKKFLSIFKDEMKTFKNKINNFNPRFMPKLKQINTKKIEQNVNSIIHENEYENLTNSSYDVVNNFKEKTKNEIKEDDKEKIKIGEEEEETKSNLKKEEKTNSTIKKDEKTNSTIKKEEKTNSTTKKDEKTSSTIKKDEKTNSTIKKEEKTNSTIKEEKEEKSNSEKEEEDKKASNNNMVDNISKLVKGLIPSKTEQNNNFNMKENKISSINNNRALNAPIYQMTSTNEGGIIRALSRKTIMRKKKSKTANKYDFLI